MMSTTEPFRRGKPINKPETTRIVEGGDERVVKRATVRRHFCGTGPFDKHWLNLDCCGLFCAVCTYALHAYGVYAVCWVVLPPWMGVTGEDGVRRMSATGLMHELAFGTIALFAVISHFTAMTTDPGAVPPDAKPLEEFESVPESSNEASDAIGLLATSPPQPTKKLCRRCRSYKPQRAHHCSVCRRCIIKMDHHCPWVNNCVGIGNHKHFLLFVFYTMLSCIYSMALIIARFATCHAARDNHGRSVRHYTCLDHPTQLINVLGLLIEAVLFGMFTSCMIFDQWDVIFSKLTHIDRIKGPEQVGTGSLAGVAEVFGIGTRGDGTRCRMDWLSPFAKACFPAPLRDEVMGFCRPVSNRAPPQQPVSVEMTPALGAQIV